MHLQNAIRVNQLDIGKKLQNIILFLQYLTLKRVFC